MKLEWKYNDKLCTLITVDYKEKSVIIHNFTDKIIEKAFGVNNNPDFDDFLYLLERRCFPKEADGMRLRLSQIGVDHYDPLNIIAKTNGKMAEDHFTLTIIEE